MSGIVGIVHGDGAPVEERLLERLTASLAWRGPDGCRWHAEGAAGLGHALLRSVHPLPGETQPCALEGRYWITADARVDGRQELVERLRAHADGVSLETPDAELILRAYAVWGPECLRYLLGDFAFAIWDRVEQRLFCARDHFGVTPFYYCHLGNTLVFSNTLDCLRAVPGVSTVLNELAVADYLLTGFNQEPGATFFRDIQMLPPAHSLSFEAGRVLLRRYWSLPEGEAPLRLRRPEEYAERFRDLLSRAVTDRLRVPEAACTLSGGMDSSAVTALAVEAARSGGSGTAVLAFCNYVQWLMPDDEPYYASLAAEKLDLAVEYLAAERYMLADGRERPWKVFPEPRGTARAVPGMEILELAAARGIRVALGGLGGDPLLELAPDHWYRLAARGRLGALAADSLAYYRCYGRRPPYSLRAYSPAGRRRRRQSREQIAALPSQRRFNPEFSRRVDIPGRIQYLNEYADGCDGRWGMANLPFWTNALCSMDPECTGLPVKTRQPFFDVRLLEFVRQVPPTPWLLDKTLLRRAMTGRLPESILRRKKTPLRESFAYAFTRRIRPEPPVELAGVPALESYVNVREVRAALRELPELDAGRMDKFVYLPLSLAFWMQHKIHTRDNVCVS